MRGTPMAGASEESGYAEQAAEFIAEAERFAALGLPQLPDDPAAAGSMRAAGYDVLAEVKELDDPILAGFAIVHVLSEDEDIEHVVRAQDVATALSVEAGELVGHEFIATYRETRGTGPVLSAFRALPGQGGAAAAEGREMTVRCLLLVGDQAELVPGDDSGLDLAYNARWPAAAIAAGTGLPLQDLPGKVFRARVTEQDGRVLFSGFSLPG